MYLGTWQKSQIIVSLTLEKFSLEITSTPYEGVDVDI